jgi:hypothetical protein
LRTCTKSQKTSLPFAGSRSTTFKSYIVRSKPYYLLRKAVENMLLGDMKAFPISALAALGKSDRFDCQRLWSQVTDIVHSSSQEGEGDSQGACRPIYQITMKTTTPHTYQISRVWVCCWCNGAEARTTSRSFEEATRFFSGKYWIYCRKSQVMRNRRRCMLRPTYLGRFMISLCSGIPRTNWQSWWRPTPANRQRSLRTRETSVSEKIVRCNMWHHIRDLPTGRWDPESPMRIMTWLLSGSQWRTFFADFQPNSASWSVVGDSKMNTILLYLKLAVLWPISTSRRVRGKPPKTTERNLWRNFDPHLL